MRYAGIIRDDLTAAPGICTTLFVQGCHFHCKGCHNPETWDFDGGYEFTEDVAKRISDMLVANGVKRTLCIMGGEPLAPQNRKDVSDFIDFIKAEHPDTDIWLWSGYTFDEINTQTDLKNFINKVKCFVTGPYIEEKRDVTLRFCGSSNQEVWEKFDGVLEFRR